MLDQLFRLPEQGTTVWTEVRAGVVTFLTLSYILFLILALSGIRTALLRAIPTPIKIATMAGIGLFLAMIGLQSAGVVVDSEATLVGLGDLTSQPTLLVFHFWR